MLAALRRAQWRLRRRGRRAVRRSARRAARLGRRLARWRWRIFPDAWLALRVALRPPTRLHGVRLRVPASLPADMRRAVYRGSYEGPELELVAEHLEPGDRVMELGGGLGVLSAFCARRVGSQNVVTYEANPALAPLVLETYRRNGVRPRFVRALVGAQEGTRTFWVRPSPWSSSLLPAPDATPLELPVRDFDTELACVAPSFVVMDVEGAESELAGATDWRGVRKLVLELHPKLLGDEGAAAVRARLAQAGFVLRAQIGDCLYLTREPRA